MTDPSSAVPLLPALLPLVAALVPLVTALIVAYIGVAKSKQLHLLQSDNAYRRYKLDKIQDSLDEVIRPRDELLIDISAKGHDELAKFFEKYCAHLDYYWERAAHYCTHSGSDELEKAKMLNNLWREKRSKYWKTKSADSLNQFGGACHSYKKCIASILIVEAKKIVQDIR
ncbi:MAG: hypothetical protein AAF495_15815 [Pseudomonadota bacterium]